jgi:hypothetical protein
MLFIFIISLLGQSSAIILIFCFLTSLFSLFSLFFNSVSISYSIGLSMEGLFVNEIIAESLFLSLSLSPSINLL